MIEFRVLNEVADVLGVFENRADAEAHMKREQHLCAAVCGTDGQEETPGRGNFRCGTLHPHGIFMQIMEDGKDVTEQDYGQYF